MTAGLREGLAWLRAHLLDDDRLVRRAPVGCSSPARPTAATGANLASWPPPGTRRAAPVARRRWPAEPPSRTSRSSRRRSPRRRPLPLRPADPTPSLGGPVLLSREPVLDNRELEARADVLTYTTAPLPARARGDRPGAGGAVGARELAVLRPVRARLRRRSDGVSWNVCDALARVSARAASSSSPTAPGTSPSTCGRSLTASPPPHRIRLQVSSGAHPRYARNPGTGEDPNARPGWSRSTSRCSTTPSTPQP